MSLICDRQTHEIEVDIPRGYEFVRVGIPDIGEFFLWGDTVSQCVGGMLWEYHPHFILKKIHEAPELIYCLQETDCSWRQREITTANLVPVRLIAHGYKRIDQTGNEHFYDVIESYHHTVSRTGVWLGYWNDGLEEAK